MRPSQLKRCKQLFLLVLSGSLLCFIFIAFNHVHFPSIAHGLGEEYDPKSYERIPGQGFQSLSLTTDQCQARFPDLTKDIDDTVQLGSFTLKRAAGQSPLQASITNGSLRILHWESKGTLAPELLDARAAALHQINRAISTTLQPFLENIVFNLVFGDQPFGTAWSYTRPAFAAPVATGPPITRVFLMPHFAFWSWPQPFIGSIDRAMKAIDAIENNFGPNSFASKDPRAVWRGTVRFTNTHHPTLREDLLRVAGGEHRQWADVQELRWEHRDADVNEGGTGDTENKSSENLQNNTAANAMMIEDFCRHKYIIHTEGITYSGRFQFHQMCASVILTPPIAWLQHTTHLVRPIFSFDLMGSPGDAGAKPSWAPSEGERKAWPVSYPAHEANIVFVAPDWSDLEATVLWLEDHSDVAEGIATRQRTLFVGGGYFSPAAEACYWRALIRGWSQVAALEGEGWEGNQGMRWEEFALGHEN